MFSEKDLLQIKAQGLTEQAVNEQINYFKSGFPFLQLLRPATINDGIIKFDKKRTDELVALYEKSIKNEKVVKFVPASGAATRMFKHLFEFDGSPKALEKLATDKSFNSVANFLDNLSSFAFYDDLAALFQQKYGYSVSEALAKQEYVKVIQTLLDDEGLQYGSLPKGLLMFHKYADSVRTPIEEHLVEGANYAASNGKVFLHFTVSPEHEVKFKEKISKVVGIYEKRFGVKYDISYSQQKKSTDTIAVDLSNEPFREEDGSLLFRPAGHGALLENLNDIDADIVLIKNIDNVVVERLSVETYLNKKLLAGALIYYRDKIFQYLNKLESGKVNDDLLDEIATFLREQVSIELIGGFDYLDRNSKIDYLSAKLNRPVRVCGMVANSGETGGGPFWAKNQDGSVSLQIVETAQIDVENPKQKEIMKASTHFNPADVACALKDYKGKKFNLLKYRDMQTGFISKKSKGGKDLKAQELPGLWNGSMSDWNSIFVEVPLITFNPVKTVNDLLRVEHTA